MKSTDFLRGPVVCALGAAGAAVLLAALLQSGSAQADSTTTADAPAPEPAPVGVGAAEPPHDPFTPYAAGPGAIPYEALDADEQRHADQAAEWADTGNGPAVQAAWSQVSQKMAQDAQVKKAAYQAGTNGLDEVGVE